MVMLVPRKRQANHWRQCPSEQKCPRRIALSRGARTPQPESRKGAQRPGSENPGKVDQVIRWMRRLDHELPLQIIVEPKVDRPWVAQPNRDRPRKRHRRERQPAP